jgi:mono/diheme cytochrome c family protein
MFLAGVLCLAAGLSLPVLGQTGSPGAEPLAASTSMTDVEIVAAGKRIWQDAACYNCHGNNGQGGHSTDFPNGPSLRKSTLDPATMLMITECGIPDTRMPAWLKGAYTETPCYADATGPVVKGVLLAGAYTREDLQNLISYVQVNFMKQPMPTWSDQ